MLSVERAVAELRGGRAVVVAGSEGRAILIHAAEATTPESLAALSDASAASPAVAITARRAAVLGLTPPGLRAVLVGTEGPLPAELVYGLADPLSTNAAAATGPVNRQRTDRIRLRDGGGASRQDRPTAAGGRDQQ